MRNVLEIILWLLNYLKLYFMDHENGIHENNGNNYNLHRFYLNLHENKAISSYFHEEIII